MIQTLFAIVVAALLVACNRLPPGWDSSIEVSALRQSECTGTIEELERGRVERIKVRGGKGRLRVEYLDAHFRCEQRVAAYAKRSDRRVEILVQPIDMNPVSVAKCDCLYNIELDIGGLGPGTHDVTLQRRWDNRHSPNAPVNIGTARTSVQ